MERRKILVINPGSTSTKVAIFQGEIVTFLKIIKHTQEELESFDNLAGQFSYRRDIILKELKEAEIKIDTVEVVVGRGGLVKPLASGIYEVNARMIDDLKKNIFGEHASNLGGLIAHDITTLLPNAKAYIADPIVVDEMEPVARISGHPIFERVSIFHTLNQKAIARQFAQTIGKNYETINVVVAHLGGGISIGAHKKGKVIDVNNALDGEGPFSPDRTGTLPTAALVKLCFSGLYTYKEVQRMVKGRGGFFAHLGTNNGEEIQKRIENGDRKAKLIQEAFAYQVSKLIGAMSVVLRGKIEGILLTGGMTNNKQITKYIKKRVSFIAPVMLYPGEDEMRALALNGYMVLQKKINPKVYK